MPGFCERADGSPSRRRRMTIWLDAHLSPAVARWLTQTFSLTALPVRDVGFRDAEDEESFFAARKSADIVMTKDADFVTLVRRNGSPPKVIWLTCGNTSDAALRALLAAKFQEPLETLDGGADFVELP